MGEHKFKPERNCCRTCGSFAKTGIDVGECHHNPPTAFSLPQAAKFGVVQISFISAFAPTKPDNWCAQWQAATLAAASAISDEKDDTQ